MNIGDVRHIRELDTFLSDARVGPEEICLTGSAVLSLYGIRPNNDLDFVATAEARRRIERVVSRRSDSRVDDDGHMKIGRCIDLSRPDRYSTIGLTDQDLINDDRYHLMVDGYKVIKLEVAFSFKAAERLPKNLTDVDRIAASHYFDSEEWDWELVRFLAPWERPDVSTLRGEVGIRGLFKAGVRNLREEGLSHTVALASEFLWSTASRKSGGRLSTITPSFDIGQVFTRMGDKDYSVPELLVNQYDTDGVFIRDDLVAFVNSLEHDEFEIPSELESVPSDGIRITPEGRLAGGLQQVAQTVVEIDSDPTAFAPDHSIRATLTNREALPPRSIDWAVRTFSKGEAAMIRDRRRALLRSTGATFFLILWPPIQEFFDEIEARARTMAPVVEARDVTITDGLAQFVKDVYAADVRNDDWVRDRKIYEFQKYEPNLRLLFLQVPKPRFEVKDGAIVSAVTHEMKMDIRRKLQDLSEDFVYSTGVHISDNYRQNAEVHEIVVRVQDGVYSKGIESTTNS